MTTPICASWRGPSPRARGSPPAQIPPPQQGGSIPASAGKPASGSSSPTMSRVHPRERGEARPGRARAGLAKGPSPRARGSPRGVGDQSLVRGSIPASAGKPTGLALQGLLEEVHPRERGEARREPRRFRFGKGPSPRARGSLPLADLPPPVAGSIPASAGKPSAMYSSASASTVHPRERGEALKVRHQVKRLAGPSPRARGSPRRRPSGWRAPWSIPASAGKPCSGRRLHARGRVHPRERGEAALVTVRLGQTDGPSPRARGSPRRSAGAPRRAPRVHPRERGEADGLIGGQGADQGPSPRARGSPDPDLRLAARGGSIPASAGKPGSHPVPPPPRGVHPRERGEARRRRCGRSAWTGPSPRARGSPGLPDAAGDAGGSIPASAGKPPNCGARVRRCGVHPRERGEAHHDSSMRRFITGPSPRARGSLKASWKSPRQSGSIPASAGKPISRAGSGHIRWVHPRERGEARRKVTR